MSLWSRLFRRKPPIIDRREPNNWKPGDLAVCICDDWPESPHSTPKAGDVLRVITVVEGFLRSSPHILNYGLTFEGAPGAWQASQFRKAVDDTEPAEAEFTVLIKRPVRKPGRVRA